MAPRGWSAPRGAQMVEPAGAGNGRWPVGEGGSAGWCRDLREAEIRGVLFANVLLQDTGVYIGGLQGTADVMAFEEALQRFGLDLNACSS